jgi:3-isopropylmalate/(R)-2-methylmalate dehydratase small subunit
MQPFTTLDGVACPLNLAAIDTDQLIPARFMVRSRADGYGGYLLHDLRFAADGEKNGAFVLDLPRYACAKIIVAPGNFGTGSSREAAVYALWDYGIRCVIAASFGDIFASNATKNGLLAAVVSEPALKALLDHLAAVDVPALSVDLEQQVITAGSLRLDFEIDPVRRLQLQNGWDDIDVTMRHQAEIEAYKATLLVRQPWALRTV